MKKIGTSCAIAGRSGDIIGEFFGFDYSLEKRLPLGQALFTHDGRARLLFWVILYTLCLSWPCFFSPPASHAAEGFVYESMFPSLQQPWHFWQPASVAATANGNLLVADTGNNRIVKFNPDGQLITTWGKYGHGDGEFDVPSALSQDSSGNIYVLDSGFGNNRVLKFDAQGKFLLAWGKSGSGQGEFSFVNGQSDIAVSPDDEIYISDTANNRIQKYSAQGALLGYVEPLSENCPLDCGFYFPSGLVFDSTGNLFVLHRNSPEATENSVVKLSDSDEYIFSFYLQAAADGTFCNLSGMAVDGSGNIFIADMTEDRILFYSPAGEPLGSFGSQGVAASEFHNPSDLCFGSDGKIYVADRDNNRIVKFDGEHQFVNSWASSGTVPGMFNNASGIAVDGNGNIFVADTGNHRVQKLSTNGEVLMVIGAKGEDEGHFDTPRNVAVDSRGNIFVADKKNNRIQKFDSQGLFLKVWGELGDGDGQFKDPVGVAVDFSGNVYVADSRNFRIQKFSSDGVFISKWGNSCESTEDNCFKDMEDIAVDASGNVYVSDQTENVLHVNRIQKFTSQGEFVLSFGEFGSQDGQLDHPFGLTVDSQGNLYVADLRNYRVEKYDPQGLFLGTFGEFGSGAGQFLTPLDVAVTPEGAVLVVDAFTNTVQTFQSQVSETPTAITKKALIVAGGGPYEGNTLWDTTRSCANFAYRTLRLKGYAKEDIYYLCDDDGLDLDGNGLFDDVHGKPGTELLETLITQTAVDADELLLYFVDHGGDGIFKLDETNELTAASLDQWLDGYEAASSGRSTLIYDACRSGSFISSLTPYAPGTRTVMTSAQGDQYAYFVSFGTISFSEYFWTAIFNDFDLTTAFRQAQSGITLLELSQTPQLDANGNSIANEDEDYDLSLSQHPVVQNGSSSGDIPVIGSADAVTLVDQEGQALIQARGVTDSDGIERVWATIIPPDYVPDSPDIPVTDLPEVELKAVGSGEDEGTYQALYDAFTTPGIYRVTIYARDIKGNSATPVTSAFVTDADSLPKAVIVSGDSEDTSRSSIYQSLGVQAKNTLLTQGFSEERISSMHAPSSNEVASAMTQWAADSDTLVFFFVGDGSSSGIRLAETQSVSPSTLKEWLDQYQNLTGGRVNVVMDADNSGQFITALNSEGSGLISRIVVTSTTADGRASFESQGLSSFSSYFWNAVFRGENLWDAFLQTANAVSFLTQSLVALDLLDAVQTPQMDDNGNGVANEDDDGTSAALFHIGLGIITGADSFVAADIEESITLEGEISTALSVKNIRAVSGIEKVWVLITPPAEAAAMQTGDTQATFSLSLPVLYLMPDNNDSYQWMYSGFDVPGTYWADYYLLDAAGTVSSLGRTTILQTIEPDASAVTVVQEEAGLVTAHVSADDAITLNLLTTLDPEVKKSVRHEWLVVAIGTADGGIYFYLFSPSGLIDLSADMAGSITEHTFPFDHVREKTTLATLTLGSLGLETGDYLGFAYAYATNEGIDDIFDPGVVFQNGVIVIVE